MSPRPVSVTGTEPRCCCGGRKRGRQTSKKYGPGLPRGSTGSALPSRGFRLVDEQEPVGAEFLVDDGSISTTERYLHTLDDADNTAPSPPYKIHSRRHTD
ncbi:hypothetical protein GCM10009727_58640 [Actinomadura napierensis]|uniref:Uncharacterized protein n=1 Tax=Actinomadura napierensis TaxID=267854 RepID=A0ABN3A2T3_9ACTN